MMLYKLVVLGDGGVGKVSETNNLDVSSVIITCLLSFSIDSIDNPGKLKQKHVVSYRMSGDGY